MDIVTILLIAVGLSMDAFAVSVTNGMVLRPAGVRQALTLGVWFGIFQGIMPLIGWAVGVGFSKSIQAFDHWIAFVLLAYIGAHMIYEALSHKQDGAVQHVLRLRNVLVMAVATSIDALAVGVSFAFTGATTLAAISLNCSIIAVVTLSVCTVGFFLGRKFSGKLGKRAEIVGGVILIAIGLKILLEHLLG